jgi:hypothetical protein
MISLLPSLHRFPARSGVIEVNVNLILNLLIIKIFPTNPLQLCAGCYQATAMLKSSPASADFFTPGDRVLGLPAQAEAKSGCRASGGCGGVVYAESEKYNMGPAWVR